jgi:hypothetical protein
VRASIERRTALYGCVRNSAVSARGPLEGRGQMAHSAPGRALDRSREQPHAYTASYCETTCERIRVRSLTVHVLRQFVDTERDFQACRRRTQNWPGGGPMTHSR